jgi:predicted nuclease with TOPRIM domain
MIKLLLAFVLLHGALGYANGVVSYSKEKKAEIESEMTKGLESVQNQIDHLKEKLKTTHGKVKSDMQTQIEGLEKDQADLKDKFSKMKKATGSAWSEIQTGTNEAFLKIKDSVKKAAAKFKE